MPGIRVRSATVADASQIAQVQVGTWRLAYRGHLPDALLDGMSVERYAAFWRDRLAQLVGSTWVVEDDDIIGFCDLMPSRDQDARPATVGEIVAIYVSPQHWRRGAGRMLFEQALVAAQNQGFQEITLWVLASNRSAMHFYEVLGFSKEGATKVEKRPDGTEFHEVRYRRTL